MSLTRRNIAANVAGRVWGVVSVYLFIPLFLRFLGPEAYGVVGFFTVLQGVLIIADFGLTATMGREMARLGATAGASERRDLARSLELLYLGIALVVGLALVLAAPAVASRWLQARELPEAELVRALRLMAIALAFQLPAGLYYGGLVGLERMVLANGLQSGWGLLRSGGAALALWRVSPTLETFFVTVLVANLAYLLAARGAYWRALGPGPRPRFRADLLRQSRRYSLGMAAMAVLSTLLIQLDKLVVSRLLPLDTFAHYSLASALSQAPVIVAAAIAGAVFPRLTALVAAGSRDELRAMYHRSCQMAAVASIPLGLTLAAFAPEVLGFWTRSAATATTAGSAVRLLLVGSTALALQLVPYYLALAFGWVGLNLRLSVAALVVMVPGLWLLVSHRGLEGAGWAWLALNVGTLPIMIVRLHRRVLPGATRDWTLVDVGGPLLASLAVVTIGRLVTRGGHTVGGSFLLALAVGACALLAAAAATPSGRAWFRAARVARRTA
jgi:O-antigen/teichoic acid export membrane protein